MAQMQKATESTDAQTERNRGDRQSAIARCSPIANLQSLDSDWCYRVERTAMDRRALLKTGGAALFGFGLAGCGASRAGTRAATTRREPLRLAPPRVSWDRIIRTTVGLRPHRDGGFLLRADKIDDKTIIHNYGHGGAGMSLAWGCGVLVADLARQMETRRIAVLGCGSPGVCSALQLQRRGYEVTIYAASLPPDTTSNMSWAGYTPTTALIEPERRTPAWDAQFRTAAEISYRQLQLLTGPR
jgi:D-amino-acid oxidase